MDQAQQLELKTSTEIDVDGYVDARGIRYLGKAILMGDGTWRCLADIDGRLCRVECTITFVHSVNDADNEIH
jgi:hypothetical protein